VKKRMKKHWPRSKEIGGEIAMIRMKETMKIRMKETINEN